MSRMLETEQAKEREMVKMSLTGTKEPPWRQSTRTKLIMHHGVNVVTLGMIGMLMVQCTVGNQGTISDIGNLCMENVGFGLIFEGK